MEKIDIIVGNCNNVEVSIIIPAYNAENYIEKSINSCLNQRFGSFEVVVVNDGSSDSTYKILEGLAKRYDKLRVIHIDNGGVSNARKVGLNNSYGKYILFVDADDYIPEDAVSILYDIIVKNSLDIAIGSHTDVLIDREQVINQPSCIYNKDEALRDLLSHGNISHSPWAKLFCRNLFRQESFFNYRRGEDYLMCIDLVTRSSRIGLINKNVYYYLNRENSAINTINTNLDLEKKFYASMLDILERNNIDVSHYNRELVSFNLWQIFAVMVGCNNLKLKKETFVQDILNKCVRFKASLTMKEKMIYDSIKYPLFQFVLKSYVHLKGR